MFITEGRIGGASALGGETSVSSTGGACYCFERTSVVTDQRVESNYLKRTRKCERLYKPVYGRTNVHRAAITCLDAVTAIP